MDSTGTSTRTFMAKNIPNHAVQFEFQYGRGMNGNFYIWKTRGGKYQWDAMGNCGEASSEKEAADQARSWIMDGYDPLADNNKLQGD